MDIKKILQESINETYQDVTYEDDDVTYDKDDDSYDPSDIEDVPVGDPGIPSAISAGLGALSLRNAIRRRQTR